MNDCPKCGEHKALELVEGRNHYYVMCHMCDHRGAESQDPDEAERLWDQERPELTVRRRYGEVVETPDVPD